MEHTRLLLPEDASALVDLFRRCYADSYANPLFYAPDKLREHIATGQLRSVVSERDNRLVGHTGLMVRNSNALVCEAGNTVVDPGARGTGLLRRLTDGLQEIVRKDGFIGYVHYPTTAHDIVQKSSVTGGGQETGILLSYIPAATEYQAIDRPGGRLAATIVFQPYAEAPARTVYVPSSYEDILVDLYRRLALDRTIVVDETVHTRGMDSCKLDVRFNAKRSVLQIDVQRLGSGFGARVQTLIEKHQPVSTYVDVPLHRGFSADAVNALRPCGFFYCGLLPEFAETDVLRVQALHRPLDTDFAPTLANPDAQALLELMRHERRIR